MILQFASKTFEIRRDTRPLFELVLTPTSFNVAYRDGSIKIKVKVKAVTKNAMIGTSGFKGTLNVACSEREVVKFQQTQQIEDETVFEIDFKKDLKLLAIEESRSFDLLASFVHDETNKTFKAATTFNVEISDFVISIVHSPQYFKSGAPYSFHLQVARIDGYPVLNSEIPITVTVDVNNTSLVNNDFDLDPNSATTKIDVEGISQNTTQLDITAVYGSLVYFTSVFKHPSQKDKFLVVNILTPR